MNHDNFLRFLKKGLFGFKNYFSLNAFFTTHAKIYYFILFSQEDYGEVYPQGEFL